jgi:hypothetical protein
VHRRTGPKSLIVAFFAATGYNRFMQLRFFGASLLALLCLTAEHPVQAAALVITNRCSAAVTFDLQRQGQPPHRYVLGAGAVLPIWTDQVVGATFNAGEAIEAISLEPNAIYLFSRKEQQIDLSRLTIPAAPPRMRAGQLERMPPASAPPDEGPVVVPVRILADDAEPTVRGVWEERLRKRVADASAIFERICRVRFSVVDVGDWQSQREVNDFELALRDFERKVRPAPARVAIGFTSRFPIQRGETHLGCTRGPFYSYILLRERSPDLYEPERLAVLVHELGHWLGAVHWGDEASIMTPKLNYWRYRAKESQIFFDAMNVYLMCQFAEEMRVRRVTNIGQLSPATKDRLRAAYGLVAAMGHDETSAPIYLRLIEAAPDLPPGPIRAAEPATR